MSIQSQMKASGVAEVIVVLKDSQSTGLKLKKKAPEVTSLSHHFTRSALSMDAALIAALSGKSRASSAAAHGTSTAKKNPPVMRYYPHLGIMYGSVDREGLASLRTENAVSNIHAAPQFRLIRPVSISKPTKLASANKVTWGIKRLGVDKLWTMGLSGAGVRVGHLDTGIDASHPALKGALFAFAEFNRLGVQIQGAKPRDSGDHGTHTAGTIAARTVNGISFGVAPGCQLASALVIEGGNVIARVLAGLDWAIGQNVRVLSMSLGLVGARDDFRPIIKIMRKSGILPVIAIGNEGPGTSRYPGNYPESLSVGAIDENDDIADFSSSQKFLRKLEPIVPDLIGPGVDVLSCIPKGEYVLSSGSSMATPHIAGLAALLFEAFPKATPLQIEQAIAASCKLPKSISPERGNLGIPSGPLAHAWLTKNVAAKVSKKIARKPG